MVLAKLKALFQRDVTGTKPGVATSEFWLSLITAGVGLLTGYGIIPDGVAAKYAGDEHALSIGLAGLVSFGYAISRGITKHGAGGAVTSLLGHLVDTNAYANGETKVHNLVNSLIAGGSAGVTTLVAKDASLDPATKSEISKIAASVEGDLNATRNHLVAFENRIMSLLGTDQASKPESTGTELVPPTPAALPPSTANFPDDVAVDPVPETVAPEVPAAAAAPF